MEDEDRKNWESWDLENAAGRQLWKFPVNLASGIESSENYSFIFIKETNSVLAFSVTKSIDVSLIFLIELS